MDDVYFEVKDYKGRTIICEKSRWFDHIIENVHHTYMDGAEQDVIDALVKPNNNCRCYDRKYQNRRVYYLYHPNWDEYTKVVVIFDDDGCNGLGRVWTAYQQDEITPGEKPEL